MVRAASTCELAIAQWTLHHLLVNLEREAVELVVGVYVSRVADEASDVIAARLLSLMKESCLPALLFERHEETP
jgi:hypothetical protein